jgi:hypothetical protein
VDERVLGLGRAAWAAVPREASSAEAWLPAAALDGGCAAGPVRAALATEIGRRAGIDAHPARVHGCWAIHVRTDDGDAAADVGSETEDDGLDGPRGCLCAHQLAFVVLTGLVEAWETAGDPQRAQHTRLLRHALLRGGSA